MPQQCHTGLRSNKNLATQREYGEFLGKFLGTTKLWRACRHEIILLSMAHGHKTVRECIGKPRDQGSSNRMFCCSKSCVLQMRITRLAQFLSCFKSHDNIHKIGYRNQAFRSANTPLEVLQNSLSKNEHAQIGWSAVRGNVDCERGKRCRYIIVFYAYFRQTYPHGKVNHQ